MIPGDLVALECGSALKRLIDEAFLEAPWYGSRQMARHLRRRGYDVGRMRVRRLGRGAGLLAMRGDAECWRGDAADVLEK